MSKHDPKRASVAIVGGGLAGMAAAAALADAGMAVEIFEGRRQLGGRAASFLDNESNEWIDLCQHVSMGCCTNLADFFKRSGATDLFRRDHVLHWIARDGRQCDVGATGWLPAPLHLAPGLWRLKFLSIGERLSIARSLLAMSRTPALRLPLSTTVADWLAQRRQSDAAIEGFWQPVLVSALADTTDRISYAAARKVFVDGFMANRDGYTVELPTVSLSELYDQHIGDWLAAHGIIVHREVSVRRLEIEQGRCVALTMSDGSRRIFDSYIAAVPWHRLAALFEPTHDATFLPLRQAAALESSPITAVHLWFDCPITELPHAVLPGRTSQWMFRRATSDGLHYYQIVISGSRWLSAEDRQAIVDTVCGELVGIWPAARDAVLLRSRVVTDRNAVFAPMPGCEENRAGVTTDVANLFLAGDWVATGWPATMEGAVRSGYLAAEAVVGSIGRNEEFLVPDLPRQWLARMLIRDD
ncbi:MAG: hydroxysqualene dehydroxylase HpnE [Pirellulales bacterium]|nr:hydroxysqualene dehydroxylase HpnE [Pirellulales bacterium]